MANDCEITVILHVGERTRVCQARRLEDGREVILKSPLPGCLDRHVVAQLAHEFRILKHLGFYPESAIALEEIEGLPTLVRPATKARPLHKILESEEKPRLPGQLKLVRSICRALERIHEAGVIHKDVNPSNILWNPDTAEVELIDFGISTRLRDEASELAPPESIEGTLAYIAPEQTGRTRLTIDRRADLYSLGATMFQIFCGRPPFEARDVAEMVHAHLAVVPTALSSFRPDLPVVISDIVAKLLSKEPEKRYQTAPGLEADLDHCLKGLEGGAPLEPFELGRQDSHGQFRIPDRLYGRDSESSLLLGEFMKAVSGQFSMMLISGYSGIGKSSLVHQVQKSVIQWRANYTSGKFDRLQRDLPYATLVQAMKGLIRQVLKGSAEKLHEFRELILEAVGGNGGLLIDVIPKLELVIGRQPGVPELPPTDAQNRFHRVLMRFIRVFATQDHPLVIFLDDLQWTDPPTLEIVERMATGSDFPYIFLIGAYRDNEIDPTHPLHLMLERLERSGAHWRSLALGPLDLESVTELVSDTLHCRAERAEPLARLCLEKTGGNPFFLGQFLKSLQEFGLIRFDKRQHRGEWNVDLIQSQQVTDNVVELMTQQVRDLPERTQRVLRLASCIGSRFDLGILAVVAQQSVSETMNDLWSSLNSSLVLPEDSSYRYAGLAGDDPETSRAGTEVRLRFLHDRVQEACYEMIPKEETESLQLEIGRLLVRDLPEQEVTAQSFEILRHYNVGASRITDAREKLALARMNLSAGRRAKSAAAYTSASDYLETGLALLDAGHWRTDYPLCFALHAEVIEVRYLCHDDEGMESLASEVLARARSPVDRAAVEEIRIQALMSRNEPVAGIRLALPILRELGIRLPSKPRKLHTIAGLLAMQWRLRKRPVEDLLYLPEMSDPEKLAAIRILYFVFSSAYFAMPNMYPLIMFAILRLSLAHGNTPASAIGYSVYGVVQCGILRKIDYGNRFGKLSLDLVEKLAAPQIKPRVIQVTQGFVTVYRKHPEELLDDFLEGYKVGLDVGDFEFAAFTAHMRCFFLLWVGTPLKGVDAEMRKYSRAIEEMEQTIPLYQQKLWHQLAANLQGQADDPAKMIGEHYDESSMVAVHEEANDAIALFFLQCCKTFLGVLFNDNEAAISAAMKGEKMNREGVGIGSTTVPIFFEWAALAWIDGCRTGGALPRRKMLRNAKRCIGIVAKWAGCAPSQAEYRLSLVRAELADLEGRHSDAISHFLDSLQQARFHRSPIDVAVACHRMGEYFIRRGLDELGNVYLVEAGLEYSRWQADGLASRLVAAHPVAEFSGARSGDRPHDSAEAFARLARSTWTSQTMTATRGEMIDLVSVVKSAQALSGEIILEKLLEKIMRIMLENAGADRGALILLKEGRLHIEAESTADGGITVLQSLPLTDNRSGKIQDRVPRDLINYVARTGQTMILEDAARLGEFVTDPYISSHQSRSIICIPLTNQGRQIGLLFLENTVARSAFSLDRVNVLSSLSAQAAIAIENARLYSNLDELNRSYARFVPHQFLEILEKKSITEVTLGDQVQGEMTILFTDIQGFTGISEHLSPKETFKLVNRFLRKMEPAISGNGGFIDKYIGDAIMGVFPSQPEASVRAALIMLTRLRELNEELRAENHSPLLEIGIGINTGSLMLGVVGGKTRLDTTVISDAVNLSARVEAMTRFYNVPLLISEHTRNALGENEFNRYIRKIDRVTPKGKASEIDVYEVFAGDPALVRDGKAAYDEEFQEGCRAFSDGDRDRALTLFSSLLSSNPADGVIECYLERCNSPLLPGPPPGERMGN